MTERYINRVKALEHTRKDPEPAGGITADFDFAQALREARSRAAAGDPIPQSPITEEMMEDPVNGEFWREMFEARERVRLLYQKTES